MRFEARRQLPAAVNLTALIDVVFILVIFVVLAANFDRLRAIDVHLPEAAATPAAATDALVVTVPASGPIVVQDTDVAETEIRRALTTHAGQFDSLVVRADATVALSRVVQILSDARAAGFESVSIATRPGHE